MSGFLITQALITQARNVAHGTRIRFPGSETLYVLQVGLGGLRFIADEHGNVVEVLDPSRAVVPVKD